MSGLWPIDYFPKRPSTQRFDEAPKLDGGLGSGTVAVIAARLHARRRVCRGSDKRSSRLKPDMDISSPRLDFCWEKNRSRGPTGFKILGNGKWKSQAHIAALYPRNSNQVTVISIDHLPRFTPLFMALPEGVNERIGYPTLTPIVA
jgi:hypothetical protein